MAALKSPDTQRKSEVLTKSVGKKNNKESCQNRINGDPPKRREKVSVRTKKAFQNPNIKPENNVYWNPKRHLIRALFITTGKSISFIGPLATVIFLSWDMPKQ